MTALVLVPPSAHLCDSYRELIREFVDHGNPLVPFTLSFDNTDFDAFLSKLADCAKGVGVPHGFVAHSTFWLVRDWTEVVGVTNIRHTLTPALLRQGGSIGYGIRPTARSQGLGTAILRLSLLRAAGLGVERALLTCDKENAASATVIVRNGGVLESEEFLPDQGEVVQRYWINPTAR